MVANADDLFSEDPTRLNRRLRQIHKLGDFPVGQGPEDRDTMKQSPGKIKKAEPGPPPGVSLKEWDKILQGKRAKTKQAAGFMQSLMGDVGSIPSMAEQYYMSGVGGASGSEENMPLELLTMAGPQVAQGAQMAQLANRLVKRPTQRMVQRNALREEDRNRIIQGLAQELRLLDTQENGSPKKPGFLARFMGKEGSLDKLGYKLQGHTDVQGIPIAIENKKGSVRSGTDSDGNEWRTKMKMPYGYIKGTKGADGEEVDVFVGPDKKAPNAFVVHQHKDSGKGYDEDKVILGHKTKADAKKAYLAHYDSSKYLGPISRVSTERLKELVASKKKLVKISHVSYRAMLDELMEKEARSPYYVASPEEQRERQAYRKERQHGLIGAGVGALGGGMVGGRLATKGRGKGAVLGAVLGTMAGGVLGKGHSRRKGNEKTK